jgi:hypothetical protein
MIKEPEFIALAECRIVMILLEAKTAITGNM